MTTYRLPDWLGGYEVTRVVRHSPEDMALVEFDAYGATRRIWIMADDLHEVPPPLPPEPEPGPYLIGDVVVIGMAEPDPEDDIRWFTARPLSQGGAHWWRWYELWERHGGEGVEVRRLVPAPEPVTLPWRSGELPRVRDIGDVSRETHVWVGRGTEVRERIDRGSGTGTGPQELIAVHSPESARAKAYALLSAADQAERTNTEEGTRE